MKVSTLIRPDKTLQHFPPAGEKFTLDELQKAVGGYIEILSTPGADLRLIVNEEGRLDGLPINPIASKIMGLPISGDVILTERELL